ncbi:MAG: ABC transporter permease subunit [Nitrospinae bacterium]|nr:ABC transporter permease subunit [Nitrospinota bacterium]
MGNFWPVYLRELRSYTATFIAYLVGVMFLLVSGVLFTMILLDYSRYSFELIRTGYAFNVEGLTVAEGILRPTLSSISFLLLFLMPLLTMKSFSEEKKSGTIEMLFTYPVRDSGIVFAKFGAALSVFAVLLGITALYQVEVAFLKPLPWREMLTGYLGLLLIGALFASIGIFVSSLTENQVIAGAWTFGMNMLLWLCGWLGGDSQSAFAEALRYLSVFNHLEGFTGGMVDTRDVVYFVSLTGLFLFFTLRVLESKRWRS